MLKQSFVKRILSMTLAVCMVLSLMALVEPMAYTVSAEAEPVLLANSPEASYEQLTFSDFGVGDGEILTEGSGKHFISPVLEGDLNEVLIRGKYTYPTKEESLKPGNIYWGLANWYGVSLNMDGSGNILLSIISNGSATTTNPAATNLTANSPIDLRGQEVEIDISIKYENTTSTTTDVKIGAWINGVLQPAGYIYVTNVPLSNLTRCFHTYDSDSNASLTVKSVKGEIKPEKKDVLLSESEENNYEKLTFSDFGIADGDILTQGKGLHFVSDVVPAGDLNEILFRGKYNFPTMEECKQFGNIYLGLAKYYGIVITPDSQGNILLDVISTSVGGSVIEKGDDRNMTLNSPVELRGEEVEIAISVKYENTTATATDLKIGVWINGVLMQNKYLYARNVTLTDLTRCFHTTDSDNNNAVKVASVKDGVTPDPEPTGTLLANSPENNYEKLTFSDFGVADGDILAQGSGKHFVSTVVPEGDLDEILFRGKYLYPTKEASLQPGSIYLGKANWWAIGLTMDGAGNIMLSVPSGTIENTALTNLTANNPNVQLRNNSDLEIAISIKYENKTTDKTDLKIGVWFNGVLQNGGYIIAKNVPLADLTRCFHTYDIDGNSTLKVASVKDEVTPEPEPEPKDVLLSESAENDYEKLTFADFGIADGDILAQGSGKHFVSTVVPEGDLDEILFRGKYLYPTKEASLLPGSIYLGRANWWAIGLTMDGAGNIMLSVPSGTIENTALTNLTANNPNVQLRNNSDLEIAISIKYENKTTDKTDLKIGVWFNGVLQNGGYIIAKNVPLADLTRCFHTYDTDSSSVINVASIGKTYTPPDVLLSESEEAGYEKLTFADFEIEDGNILTQGNGLHFVSSVALEGDLDEVLFQGKYTYPTMEASAKPGSIYLGRANWWAIGLTMDGTGNIMLSVPSGTIENTALTNLTANNPNVQLRGKEVEIAISIKYENKRADKTDLKIGVWFDGVLQNGGYIIAKDVPLADLTRCFHTYDTDSNAGLKVASVGKTYVLPDVLLSESEEVDYEKLTFADFGAMDGQILSGKTGEKVTYATLPGTLDGILFQGKYNFPSMEKAKQFGNIYLGRPDWWAIGIVPDSAGNINLNVISDGSGIDDSTLCNLTQRYSDVQLRENEDLEIAISVKYENTTATTTDLKIGIWVNGVLKQGKYIYARNVLLSDLTRCLHTYDSANDCGVGVVSVGQWKINTLPVDFADITLSDGNIPDGDTFTYGNFARIESLDKTLFSANVQFNTAGARLHLGCTPGAANGYSGMGLRLESNGTLVLGNELGVPAEEKPNVLTSIGLNFFVFNSRVAGLGDTFTGKNFLLQISTEFVDCDNDGEKDDIKLGVFFDGVLYCNNYIYIPGEAQTLSTGVNFNGGSQGFAQFSSVRIQELTNADLGINKGVYTAAVNGEAGSDSLNGTAITTEVTFGKGTSIAYGKEGKGIVFTYAGEGVLKVSHVRSDGTSVAIGEVKIPANRAVQLRTTMEFIKEGTKTNLKLGVFVNGTLSGYGYFLVEDVDASVLTRSMSVIPSDGEIRIGANAYENLTLRDFIMADKTRSDYGARFSVYEGANYNNTAFSAVLTFSDETEKKNDNCFYIGGKQWAGLRVDLNANGELAISFVHADGVQMQLARVTPEEVGMTTFQGKAFDYRVTFDVVEAVEGRLDAVIGVYVNDTLCKGKHLLVKGVDAVVLERGLFSYVDKNGGSLTMESTNPTVDFTIFGLSKDWAKTLGIK